MGGMKSVSTDNGTAVVANVFQFSVDESRTDVIAKLKAAMLSGERVTLTYSQIVLRPVGCKTDTSYYITEVKQ